MIKEVGNNTLSNNRWSYIVLLVDIIILNTAAILSFYLRFAGEPPTFNFKTYYSIAIPFTLSFLLFFYVYELYSPQHLQSGWEILSRLLVGSSLAILTTISTGFFLRLFSLPRLVILILWLLVIISIFLWRLISSRAWIAFIPKQKVLLVGTGELVESLYESLSQRKWGYKIIGVVRPYNLKEHDNVDSLLPVLGGINDVPELIKAYNINKVIVTSPAHHRELVERIVEQGGLDVLIDVVPDLYEIFIGKMEHTLISDVPLVALNKETVVPWISLIKKIFDITLAGLLVVLLLPLFIMIAIAIKVSSRGPVFYKQLRTGKNLKNFYIYKFRSMYADAESEIGPVLATENDRRVTAVGKILRRWRIDEFPQLINVLMGDMSFVGPRPERPEFIKNFINEIPGYSKRFQISPGITGLAQISGKYSSSPENKLKYDLIYVCHRSFFLDIQIVLQTLRVILEGRGF